MFYFDQTSGFTSFIIVLVTKNRDGVLSSPGVASPYDGDAGVNPVVIL